MGWLDEHKRGGRGEGEIRRRLRLEEKKKRDSLLSASSNQPSNRYILTEKKDVAKRYTMMVRKTEGVGRRGGGPNGDHTEVLPSSQKPHTHMYTHTCTRDRSCLLTLSKSWQNQVR